jgi:outer membrane cobalamin receptor
VEVRAPGFAPGSADVREKSNVEITIQLQVSTVTETVVVTATRSPVIREEAGASVDTLENAQLTAMQPVAAADAIRFLPGAVINTAGQRGGIASLFVRGGDSRYNKVIIDDVTVNEPGGTYDFGVVPLGEADRMEFVRGAQSTLYGSDAMTSVVQVFTRTGGTATPELRFGADGGTFGTAHGYAALSGARSRYDFNFFGDQFNTNGQGPNDLYSNSLVGMNVGVAISNRVLFRTRIRHFNAWSGVPNEWKFNGTPLQAPDPEQHARQNTFLASAQLVLAGPSRWQHRLTGFEYNLHRHNINDVDNAPDRVFDFPFHNINATNRAGFDYQGDYQARTWARATVGYQFEDENAFVGDPAFGITHGLRLNHAVFGQLMLEWNRFSLIAGLRFVHNETFGNKGVPRVALGIQALKGGDVFTGTRLRFSYSTGIKEPRFDEAFAQGPFIIPNPNLKAEENHALEAGVQQSLLGGKYSISATYYNNLFRNQIDFAILDFTTFVGQYQNIDKSIAHGAELEAKGRITARVSVNAAYTYTSTQILEQPFAFDNVHQPGQPLLRRPKHLGSLLVNYLGTKWGANLGGSFVGRRPDSDFLGFNIDHAAGYALVNVGGWYAIRPRVTAYVNVDNALNQHYNEVVGFPALTANVRAGLRFRLGGE